jgi:hypothetical protein
MLSLCLSRWYPSIIFSNWRAFSLLDITALPSYPKFFNFNFLSSTKDEDWCEPPNILCDNWSQNYTNLYSFLSVRARKQVGLYGSHTLGFRSSQLSTLSVFLGYCTVWRWEMVPMFHTYSLPLSLSKSSTLKMDATSPTTTKYNYTRTDDEFSGSIKHWENLEQLCDWWILKD